MFFFLSFIGVKTLFTVRLTHFRPQMYKLHNIFDFNKKIKQFLYRYGQAPLVAES